MQSEKVAQHIIHWLKDYANNAGIKGFVVGVSGGIDSAVTAALCARTGLEVLLIEMPIHQSENQVNRAWEHMRNLENRFEKVRTESLNLSPVYDSFIDQLPKHNETEAKNMALVNTRARLRMTTLYYYGQLNGYLVAGTGNKVEDFGVGFYTKYGDGGVDVSPIADLLKSEVYQIGEYVKVPKSIMVAAPSDGLYGAERTDEQQIGASYDELEQAMSQVESKVSMDDLSLREKEVLKIYLDYNRRNQHKMNPIPVCIIPEDLK